MLMSATGFSSVGLTSPAGLQARRSGYGLGWVYSCINSLKGCAYANSKMQAGMFHCFEVNAIDGDRNKAAPILSTLLLHSCPPAVFRRIVFVWIYAINRVFSFWPFSHVFKKRLKVMHPTVTDLDSTASPIFKVFVLFVVAPSLHSKPRPVLNSSSRFAFVAVLGDAIDTLFNKLFFRAHVRAPFFSITPARLQATTSNFSKVGTCGKRDIPAVTKTLPHFGSSVFFKHKKPAEFLAFNVY